MKKVLMNWSGGKDSSLCLHHLLKNPKYEVVGLLTSVNEEHHRVSMHGVRESLIKKQAEAIGFPLHFLRIPKNVTMDQYSRLMRDTLRSFKDDGIEYCAFGDIFLEHLRTYREEKLSEVGMKALFPLWNQPTLTLAHQFIDDGFRGVLSALDGSRMGKQFVGREYDNSLLKDLPDSVDPCGEYGEFHSFVYDGPIFKRLIPVGRGEVVKREYESSSKSENDSDNSFSHHSDQKSATFWFVDLYQS